MEIRSVWFFCYVLFKVCGRFGCAILEFILGFSGFYLVLGRYL